MVKTRGRGFIQENKGIIQDAYDATSGVGKISTILGTIFGNIILIIVLIIGIVLVRSKDTLTATVLANVTKIENCVMTPEKTNACNVSIEYSVNNEKYNVVYTSTKLMNVGQTLSVRYDPANPNNFSAEPLKKSTIGWWMIGIAIFGLIASWVWLWFILSYKAAAAAAGVGVVADLAIPDN